MPNQSTNQSKFQSAVGNSGKSKRGRPGKQGPTAIGPLLLRHPNDEDALGIVIDQEEQLYTNSTDGEIASLEWEVTELEKRFKRSSKRMDELDDKLANTKPYVKAGKANSGSDAAVVPFKDWQIRDRFLVPFLTLCIAASMVLGASNVFANLMASGNVVFLENPSLARSLSLLLPLGSIAIKFLSNFFDFDKTRRRYALFVYILTLLVLSIWAVLFSLNFTGITPEIDWGSFGDEPFSTGSALVWSQLVLEMLTASALALALEDIVSKYSPSHYMENLDFLAAKEARDQFLPIYEADKEQLKKAKARLATLQAAKQTRINLEAAKFIHRKGRFDADASD